MPSAPRNVPAARQAALISFTGRADIYRGGEAEPWKVAVVPTALSAGDRVRTDRDSAATIRFQDGSQVELGPGASFTIQKAEPQEMVMDLAFGRLRAIVSKIRSRRFSVRTPVAVASVRGTEFTVDVADEKNTKVEVREGLVAVAGLVGDEVLVKPNERIEVFQDRMGRPERVDRADREPGDKESRRHDGEHLKTALEREVGFQLGRDAIETAAAFEMKNALYQEGKTLIDAFGQRVRLEQYITRPDPSTFKFVTLNFRDHRLDHSFFEVTANKPLPDDLGAAGDLWFSPSDVKPEFYAVKQRWVLSNTQDSITQLSVDGDSRRFEFTDQPIPDGRGGFLPASRITFYRTVFGNNYEFINGKPVDLDAIWSGASRPTDLPEMMWHTQPVQVDIRTADISNTLLGTYYDYAFVNRGGGPATGKLFIDDFAMPDPFLAHFVQRRSFLDYADSNGNGFFDPFGEQTLSAEAGFSGPVYHDRAALFNGTNPNGTWQALAALPGGGCQGTNSGCTSNLGDNALFSDLNGSHLSGGTNPTLALTGNPVNDIPNAFALAKSSPRDWLQGENFVINDEGKLLDFRDLSIALGAGGSADAKDDIADAFERLNFEQVLTSSRFAGRKIDVVMSPHIFLKAGLIDPDSNRETINDPGKNQ